MSYKFYLRDTNSTKETAIQLVTHINGKRFKYGIGLSIYPELWDMSSQAPTKDSRLIRKYEKLKAGIKTELENILIRMENVQRSLMKVLLQYETNNLKINFNDIRKALDQDYKENDLSAPLKKSPFLIPYIDDYISGMKKGTILISTGKSKGKRFSDGTIKNYKGFYEQMVLFEKSIGKKIRFSDVDFDLYNSLLSFFSGKGYKPNTMGRHIRNFKVIMQGSYDAGLHSNLSHRKNYFTAMSEDVTDIYLTADELNKLKKVNLSQKPAHQLALDVFLTGCYTALRYSDYSRISPEHIKTKKIKGINGTHTEIQVIDMITKKNKTRVVIPIMPELKQILEKYDYKLPKTYEQKVNKYIKEVGESAGINELIHLDDKTSAVKHTMIKTHTARRTGATLMYKAKINNLSIMKITGHKTEKSFLKYIKVDVQENADDLSQNKYFGGGAAMEVVNSK